ncbi:MAG TPA: metal-dependent transcriptional regulator [Methanothrix sp.]|jgi:DtxR family Mn-dependent transcriptional regulator|nr:MAG: manganese transport transcriptional regulator [Methanosaeta sp. PtaB.Bin087]HNR58087.1 metal-dependent transcriptional regulator [Methanothrix sp.]HOI69106.1 metal-dependent transcriptional regulator [Methanothrix sp.]HPY72902.1 metal-dependent transcriptional regulator [Methanothrix sp.]HQA62351.1 metal-dependent transcriptional regulator [Methanothrix sp.]
MMSKLSRKAEDYLEAIFEISQEKGYARVRDISQKLDIRPPSVVEMVKKLDELGYVVHKKQEGVFLTPKGEEIGRVIKDRHDTIKAFLMLINVPEPIADKDACIMEHKLDTKTVEQIKNLVKFIQLSSDRPPWLDHFDVFCRTGEHFCGISDECRSRRKRAEAAINGYIIENMDTPRGQRSARDVTPVS